MGNFLNRDELLKKEELQIVKVEFESGDYVFVRGMTGHERDIFEGTLVRKGKDAKGAPTFEQATEDYRAKLAVCTVCDEAGKLVFIPRDYMKLSEMMSAKRLETIINKSQELNKISEEDKEALVKNSVADPVGNSSLGSVENSDTVTPITS
jgi:hypothetical protein